MNQENGNNVEEENEPAEGVFREQAALLESNLSALQQEMPENPSSRVRAKLEEVWKYLQEHEELAERLAKATGGAIGGGFLGALAGGPGGAIEGAATGAGLAVALGEGSKAFGMYLRRKIGK